MFVLLRLTYFTQHNTLRSIHVKANAHSGQVTCVTASPHKDSMFLLCGEDNRILLWDTRCPKPALQMGCTASGYLPTSLAWHPQQSEVFVFGLLLVLKHHDGAAHKLVCYFASWAQSRPGPASVLPHDLDPFLCTHLIFAFATMENNQIVAMTSQKGKIVYPEFNKLKERNRELRTLLSIGGWDFGTSKFTTMLSTLSNRKKFINSVILLLRTYNFDGLDLFFLYPGLRGSPMSDRRTFLLLIKELLFAFQNEVKLDTRPRLLLSAAVSGDPYIIQIAYDVHLLGKLLDFINVLSYDFHGSWEKFTGHNSPLFSLPGDPSSSAYAMNYWRKLGAPPEKLLMGFPTYGRTYHLLKASKNGLQAKAVGPASPGMYTKHPGFLAYYEICSFLQRATKRWIDFQQVPYAYKGKVWVGYDDANSFSSKAMFIKEEHFGGAMVWTLDLDDAKGTFCRTGPFPLVHKLHSLLVQAGGKSTATNMHGKSQNTTTTSHRGGTVSPTSKTASFVRHTVALEGKTETVGEMTGRETVTLGEMTMISMQLLTSVKKDKPFVKRAVASEMMTIPSGKMKVTPDGQTKILRGENLTSEVNTDSLLGYVDL
ncbi:oviduct-specific glycoprotein isoform X1 [Canis lupus familiaris]|uniref:oviduct-specific glycoprotein isoform X1 n=1 Tax=Canis lupus familiaris TaxID=9615 RepID=UPI0018F6404A|nr:oviduct-specific glycoprotein isoform X1 [Canis lupus familiaris]